MIDMASALMGLANGVRDAIESRSFASPIRPHVEIKPCTDLESLRDARASVVPINYPRVALTRGKDRVDPVINVAVQQLVANEDTEAIGRLIETGEQLAEMAIGLAIEIGGVKYLAHSAEVISVDHQEEHHQGILSTLVAITFSASVTNGR